MPGTEIGVENFRMNVANYKQVGSWYWQTDGIELYDDGQMKNTFFHANDDVLKIYHNRVKIKNTVIWKNENGPVVQWGWVPRNIDGVTVRNTDVIHNRMYWKDVKYNTCVFNSSSHYEDMGATDRADPATTVQNMTFTDTRVEGAVNCAIRVFALSEHREHQHQRARDREVERPRRRLPGQQAQAVHRPGRHQGDHRQRGPRRQRIATAQLHRGRHPDLEGGQQLGQRRARPTRLRRRYLGQLERHLRRPAHRPRPEPDDQRPRRRLHRRLPQVTFSGTTNAARLTIRVNGTETRVPLRQGRFSTTITLPNISNRIVITAIGRNGVMTVDRRTITAYGDKIGAVTDPAGDDNGPGNYTYPTDGAFNPGSLDLTGLEVYRRRRHRPVRRLHRRRDQQPVGWQRDEHPAAQHLPQRRTVHGHHTVAAWHQHLRQGCLDLRHRRRRPLRHSRFGSGVYGANQQKVGNITLDVNPAGKIIASVAANALSGLDLRTAGYLVSMFSDAEDGEGIGNIRPVYSAGGPYRVGGGAGDWTDAVASRDTDTRDSNALDIISGNEPQSGVMDWTKGPVVAPYVQLAR